VIGEGVSEPGAVLKLLQTTARHPQGKDRDDRYGAGIVDAGRALAKTTTSWGGYRLGLAALLGLLLLGRLHERKLLGLRPGLGVALGALVGAAGLFFLPSLGISPTGPLASLALQGFPSWDLALLGPAGHANPLFFSALVPLGLAALLYRVPRARGFVFGFAVGVAAHLVFHVFFRGADVAWLPGALLDHGWLLLNAAACVAVAHVVARR
jgi:serine protease